MSSGTSDPHGSSSASQRGPPYAPRTAGLGGTPEIIPDVPISVVFLVLYLVFGVIHIKIFKSNKSRGHKFVFNGAILGLCKIRIITMSLRIAWSCYPRNTGLAIAANVFVYVGTIIVYAVDWFFAQRIVRAQHPALGWSTPYRIFFRGALVCLVISLLMLIIASIWQFFTLNSERLRIFHALFLTGQTYFTVFCIAPAVLVFMSLVIPRTEVDKFGAGRLRNNITILLVAVLVLSVGQVFRCVLAWIPATPLQPIQSGAVELPWYLTKPCFYTFNFVTELIVIIMFALVRVDLRFHVPNGARQSGDYSSSRVNVDHIDNEKNTASAPGVMTHQNDSDQTIHHYNSSVFEDSQTLADSLRYPSSTLEVDEKTGNWKVKRVSGASSSHASLYSSSASRTSLQNNRLTLVDSDAPPVPEIPEKWPLPDSIPTGSSVSVLEHTNPPSRRGTPKRHFEIIGHQANHVNVGDAVTDALARLEHNSEKNQSAIPTTSPPYYDTIGPVEVYKPTLPNEKRTCPTSRKTHNRSTHPSNAALGKARSRSSEARRSYSSDAKTPPITEVPEVPQWPEALASHPMRRTSPTNLDIISLVHKTSAESHRIVDATLMRDEVSTAAPSEYGQETAQSEMPASSSPSRVTSSKYSGDTTSSDGREAARAVEEFRRFSYEAPPREV